MQSKTEKCKNLDFHFVLKQKSQMGRPGAEVCFFVLEMHVTVLENF